MAGKKKSKRGPVGTWYAVHALDDNDLWWGEDSGVGPLVTRFPNAQIFTDRRRAVRAGKKIARGYEIVDVRCRALSTKTKASKKRTK